MYKKDKKNKKAQWIMFLDDPNSREVKEIMRENKGGKRSSNKSNGAIRRRENGETRILKIKSNNG